MKKKKFQTENLGIMKVSAINLLIKLFTKETILKRLRIRETDKDQIDLRKIRIKRVQFVNLLDLAHQNTVTKNKESSSDDYSDE